MATTINPEQLLIELQSAYEASHKIVTSRLPVEELRALYKMINSLCDSIEFVKEVKNKSNSL